MFAKNNRISGRQAFRLFTYDLLGYGTLMIPAVLAKTSGTDGIFAIFIGIACSLIYLKVLRGVFSEMKGGYAAYLTKTCGKFFGAVLKGCYGVYFLLLSGYVAQLFARLVLTELLRDENFYLILFLILLFVFYGVTGGIEGRARIYELLFWFLMIPLFTMLVFAVGEIDVDYWTPTVVSSFSEMVTGSYYVFLCLSLIFLTLFIKEHLPDTKKVYKSGRSAILFAGGVFAVLYLVLLGLFGEKALSVMEFPAVAMMSRVQITGGFLKRTDAFMFGIWFFTLYALLNSTVYYGGTVVSDLFGRKEKRGKLWVIFLELCMTFYLACVFYFSVGACETYERFLWCIGTPFVVIVPVLLFAVQKISNKKVKKAKGFWKITGLLLPMLLLSGCKTAEVEDKSFPLMITVRETEDFCKDWLNLRQSGNEVLDYNHLKVILIEQAFLENDALMEEMLEILEQDKDIPLNTYVLGTADADEIMDFQEEMEEALGTYLEELLENMPDTKKSAYPTLGMLYQEKENRMETLFIPCIGMDKEKPAITSYEVWKRGSAAGIVDNSIAMLSFFTGNQLKEYTLQLEKNHFIRLTNVKSRLEFSEDIAESGVTSKVITAQIDCEGELIYQNESLSLEETKELLDRQLTEYLNETADAALLNEVDVTNSLKKLGGYQREWYEAYQNTPAFYEKDISIVYQVDVKWRNL